MFFEVDPALKLDALTALLFQYRPRVGGGVLQHAPASARPWPAISQPAAVLGRSPCMASWINANAKRCWCVSLIAVASVLVASDVAARGLDIADLPMVINFDHRHRSRYAPAPNRPNRPGRAAGHGADALRAK
jgi:hypothetical protein